MFWKWVESRQHWFWNRGLRHLLNTCIEGWKKFNVGPVSFFIVCFVTIFFKEKKATLTCILITWLLIFFDSPSYHSELRKRYKLRLLLMYFRGRDFWKLLCLGRQMKWLEGLGVCHNSVIKKIETLGNWTKQNKVVKETVN